MHISWRTLGREGPHVPGCSTDRDGRGPGPRGAYCVLGRREQPVSEVVTNWSASRRKQGAREREGGVGGGPDGGRRLPRKPRPQPNPEDEPVSSTHEAGSGAGGRGDEDAQDGARVRTEPGRTPQCPRARSWVKRSVARPWAGGRVAACARRSGPLGDCPRVCPPALSALPLWSLPSY